MLLRRFGENKNRMNQFELLLKLSNNKFGILETGNVSNFIKTRRGNLAAVDGQAFFIVKIQKNVCIKHG